MPGFVPRQKRNGKVPPPSIDGNSQQLLNYAQTHTSQRALRALRVEKEVERARREGALPTVAEIQARHNFTEEAAQSFIRSIQRAMRSNSSPKSKITKPKLEFNPSSDHQSQQSTTPQPSTTPPNASADALQTILQNIRYRYSDEIRIHGEQTLVREGFVYIVTHPCFDGWVKAGMTIDFELRIGTYNVSDPLSRFELTAVKWVIDRRLAEKRLLEALHERSKEMRGEWARIELSIALSVLESL